VHNLRHSGESRNPEGPGNREAHVIWPWIRRKRGCAKHPCAGIQRKTKYAVSCAHPQTAASTSTPIVELHQRPRNGNRAKLTYTTRIEKAGGSPWKSGKTKDATTTCDIASYSLRPFLRTCPLTEHRYW